MRSFLSAFALCAVLQPALADGPAAGGLQPTATAMHAALAPVVTAQAGPRPGPSGATVVATALKPGADADAKPPQPEDQPPTTVAMLLTAFAVMTGIALRRWGSGQS